MLTENLADCWNQSWKPRRPTVMAITKYRHPRRSLKTQKSHFPWKCLFCVCVKMPISPVVLERRSCIPISVPHVLLSQTSAFFRPVLIHVLSPSLFHPEWESSLLVVRMGPQMPQKPDSLTTLSVKGTSVTKNRNKVQLIYCPMAGGACSMTKHPLLCRGQCVGCTFRLGSNWDKKRLLFQSRGFAEHETFVSLG